MKKVLSYVLILVMMFSLVACGSKSSSSSKSKSNQKEEKVDAVDTIVNVLKNLGEINSVEAELSLDVNGKVEGEKVKASASLDLEISDFLTNNMEAKLPFSAELSGEGKISGTAYWSDGYIYIDLDGEKYKVEVDFDFDDLEGIFDIDVEDEISDDEREEIEETLKPKATKKGDKYVVTIDLTEELLDEVLDEYEDYDIQLNEYTISITADKNYCLDEISCVLDMDMEYEGSTLSMTFDFSISFSSNDISIKMPSFDGYTDISSYLDYYL